MNSVSKVSASRLANRRTEWLKPMGSDSDIVLTTLVCVARNLVGHNFPNHAELDELRDILFRVREAVDNCRYNAKFSLYDISSMEETARFILLERRIISGEMAHSDRPWTAAAVLKGEELSFMVNEEDHLRVQSIISGLEADRAWKKLNRFFYRLEDELEFAYNIKLGWLTCSPTEVGTGLKISFFCHLPALALTEKLEELFEAVLPASIVIRGLFGEDQHYLGDIFQISNQATLGQREEEIIQRTTVMAREVVKAERMARDEISRNMDPKAVDRVHRSYAILTHAQLLGAMEFIGFISALRLGINLGWITGMDLHSLNKLMIKSLPGHLLARYKKTPPLLEQDRLRAVMVRSALKDTKLA